MNAPRRIWAKQGATVWGGGKPRKTPNRWWSDHDNGGTLYILESEHERVKAQRDAAVEALEQIRDHENSLRRGDEHIFTLTCACEALNAIAACENDT